MAGAGGDWVRGPFECQCQRCRRHTDRELLVEGMKIVAGPFGRHGGRVIWKAVTDRPTLVASEVANFANLDDALPPNVTVAHKSFYKDFRPPAPFSRSSSHTAPRPNAPGRISASSRSTASTGARTSFPASWPAAGTKCFPC